MTMAIQSLGRVGLPLLVVTLLTNACTGGGRPVDPALVEAEESRLLRPFERDQVLVSTDFDLVVSANFYNQIAQRVDSQMHATSRDTLGGDTIYTFRVKTPGTSPLEFHLAGTRLVATDRAKIRVLGGRHAPTLDLAAREVTMHRGSQVQAIGSFEVRDGLVTAPR